VFTATTTTTTKYCYNYNYYYDNMLCICVYYYNSLAVPEVFIAAACRFIKYVRGFLCDGCDKLRASRRIVAVVERYPHEQNNNVQHAIVLYGNTPSLSFLNSTLRPTKILHRGVKFRCVISRVNLLLIATSTRIYIYILILSF